jgi:hypothetical protein
MSVDSVAKIGSVVGAAGTEGLPTSDAVHEDAALFATLGDYFIAIVAADVLNKLAMAGPEMRRGHLSLTQRPRLRSS